MLKRGSLVHELSTAGFGGTGPVTLAGTPPSKLDRRRFRDVIGDTHACEYIIKDGSGAFERTIGVLTEGATDQLSRDVTIESSAGGAKVNFNAGQKDVYLVGREETPGVRTVTASGALTVADHGRLILADAGAGAITLTLPAAATAAGEGFKVRVLKTDASVNPVILDGNGAETVNGAATLALTAQFDAAVLHCDGAAWYAPGARVAIEEALPLPTFGVSGLIPSNDLDTDHDINVTDGWGVTDDLSTVIRLPSEITKRIDAPWAVGDDAGGLDNGAVAANTWYHLFAIRRSDTGVVDVLFSLSPTSPNMPPNYDQKTSRIAAVLTDGAANINQFVAREIGGGALEVQWVDPPLDVDVTNQGISAVARTLSVPTGIQTRAHFNVGVSNGSNITDLYVRSIDANDEAPSGTAGPLVTIRNVNVGVVQYTNASVVTDASGQCTTRALHVSTTVKISTLSYVDPRI